MNDIIQPRFDHLSTSGLNQTEVALQSIDSVLDRISSGLEFIQTSLATLELPVSLRDDAFAQMNNYSSLTRFIRLTNTESGISKPYSSLGLDFMLPIAGVPSRYSKMNVVVLIHSGYTHGGRVSNTGERLFTRLVSCSCLIVASLAAHLTNLSNARDIMY